MHKKKIIIFTLLLVATVENAKGMQISDAFCPDTEPMLDEKRVTIRHAPMQTNEGRSFYVIPPEQSFESLSARKPIRHDEDAVVYDLSREPMPLTIPSIRSRPSRRPQLVFSAAGGLLGLAWNPALIGLDGVFGWPYGSYVSLAANGAMGALLGAGVSYLHTRLAQPSPSQDNFQKLLRGTDRRTRVEDSQAWPWRGNGSLQAELITPFGAKIIVYGSGTLVGPRHVLTAAHNLYDHKLRQQVQNVVFFPGLRGTAPYWTSGGLKIILHPRYVAARTIDEQLQSDIGMVILDEDLGVKLGHFGLRTLGDNERPNVTIAGYPGEREGGTVMYHMTGPITEHKPLRTWYDVDTSHGQSGSGVWLWTKDNEPIDVPPGSAPPIGSTPACVAVHTWGGDDHNSGTRLEVASSRLVQEWRTQL